MDEKEFRKVMAIMFKAYRKDLDQEVAKSYYLWLKEYPLEDVKRAIYSAVKVTKYFPSVSELIEMIHGKPVNKIDIKADIIKQIGDTGIYGKPVFIYEISEEIAKDIGWGNMCRMKESALHDTIHYRYQDAVEKWRDCKVNGTQFLGGHKAKQIRSGTTKSIGHLLKNKTEKDINED